jgi:hypothetical protein
MKRFWWMLVVLVAVAGLLLALPACDDDDDDDDAADDDTASVDDDDDATPGDDDDDDDDNDDDDDDDDNDDDDDDDDDNDTAPGDPIEPTAGFLARQAEYLAYCNDHNGPGEGGRYGQVCRAYTGTGDYNEVVIREALDQINAREDTADFALAGILRLLFLDRANPTLPDVLRDEIEAAVLGFKYWLDEPGPDDLCWWSENHQILYHSDEYLAGQLFPTEVFTNSGMTGAQHVDHAAPRVHRWLNFRGLFGFSEFHSNVYFNEDMPPLVNLVDFADDEAMATKAAMVLDIVFFDLAMNYYDGLFATCHGRTYQSKLLDGLKDSTRVGVYVGLGLTDYGTSTSDFTGSFLATSDKYAPAPVLESIAVETLDGTTHKQRDGIDVAEGPDWGLTYDDYEDVMFWWGMTGYAHPEIITGTFDMVEHFDMWEGFMFSDLQFLRALVGSPLLEIVANAYEEMAAGVTLEKVSTYTYRTPDYQLSGAQDFKPGNWSAQVHVWQATIDKDAYVFTTYPGGFADDYMAGPWTGGFLPRATFYENVGVIQYRRPVLPLVDQLLFVDYSHAYFPKNEFDEVVETTHWTIARKGDSYVALYSQEPPVWSLENDYELIADSKENVWIVELGDVASSGAFNDFVTAVSAAEVTITDEKVRYDSPSQTVIEVGWTGDMTVGFGIADIGPYERFENDYCTQEFGDDRTIILHGYKRLDLDFDPDNPRRRYWEN